MAAVATRYSGSVTIPSGATVPTAQPSGAWAAADSVLTWTARSPDGTAAVADNYMVSAQKGEGTITFARSGTPSFAIEIAWEIVEFDTPADVVVQDVTRVGGGSISVTAVDDQLTTFLVASADGDSTQPWNNSSEQWFNLTFTSNSAVNVGVGSSGDPGLVAVQVVEYLGANPCAVQRFETATAWASIGSDTDSFTAVSEPNTFILAPAARSSVNVGLSHSAMNLEITDDSTLQYTRGVGSSTGFTTWTVNQIVDLVDDGVSVQRGTIAFTSSETVATDGLTAVDDVAAVMFPIMHVGLSLGSIPSGTALPIAMFTLAIDSDTVIEGERGSHGSVSASLTWQVVEWNGGGAAPAGRTTKNTDPYPLGFNHGHSFGMAHPL